MTVPDNALNHVPLPASDIHMEIVDNELLLYHPQQTRATYLNSTAAIVWGLCDGHRSVRDIIQAIGDSYPDAGTRVTEDVLVTVDELCESGLLVMG